MKGMILAAGKGTRLRPLTYTTPKPMLLLAGRPLLEHIIINLRSCGVTDLAINLFHLPEQVIDYFGNGQKWGVNLHYSIEDELLGSAGGVKNIEDFFDGTFLIYYGDVFTLADFKPMIEFHRQAGVTATMGLYKVPDPWNRGIVALDERQRVTKFVEKPSRENAFSNLANAGFYVLEPEVLDVIPAGQHYDFGHDVFPKLLTQGTAVAGYVINHRIIDIGLLEKYREADQFATEIALSN